MPKIKVSDILEFKSESSKVRPYKTIPILSFIKMEFNNGSCVMTKNGLKSFVKKTITSDSNIERTILVDEKKFFNFCEISEAEEVEIKANKTKVQLSDGKTVASFPTDDLTKFPKNDTTLDSWYSVPKEIIDSVSFASNFVLDGDMIGRTEAAFYIYIGNKFLAAANGTIGFFKHLNSDCPNIILRKEVAIALASLKNAQYSFNNSYDFFKQDNLLYAFAKDEAKFHDLRTFADIGDVKVDFSLLKDDLIKFNQLCKNSSDSKVITAVFEGKEDKLLLSMKDTFNTSVNKELPIKSKGSFSYNPEAMNLLLQSIPAMHCCFYPGSKRYYITDENKSFISLIMGVV